MYYDVTAICRHYLLKGNNFANVHIVAICEYPVRTEFSNLLYDSNILL
jgi:hypothetical protein